MAIGTPKRRIGIVSHVLPPAHSGQAIVLARLLAGIPPESYVLIGRSGVTEPSGGTPALAATSYLLEARRTSEGLLTAVWRLARALQRLVVAESLGAVVVASGDLLFPAAATLVAHWENVPLIPYYFDDYAFQWTGRRRIWARLVEPWLIRRAQAIITPNEFMQGALYDRYGVETALVRNPAPLPDLAALDRLANPFPTGFNLVYSGSVYHAQADALASMRCALGDDVRLHLFTPQSPGSVDLSSTYFVYHEPVPSTAIAAVHRHADALFLPLSFASPIPEVIRTSAPGKMADYLAVGRPILVHAPEDCFVSWYFRRHECGVVVSERNPALLSQAIAGLRSDPGYASQLGHRARSRAEADFGIATAREAFWRVVSRTHANGDSTR